MKVTLTNSAGHPIFDGDVLTIAPRGTHDATVYMETPVVITKRSNLSVSWSPTQYLTGVQTGNIRERNLGSSDVLSTRHVGPILGRTFESELAAGISWTDMSIAQDSKHVLWRFMPALSPATNTTVADSVVVEKQPYTLQTSLDGGKHWHTFCASDYRLYRKPILSMYTLHSFSVYVHLVE